MTYKDFLAGIVVAGVAVTATAALAMGSGFGGPRHEMSFDALDRDGNGEVTREEMQMRAQDRFARADSDGDGRLTRDEMMTAAQARMEDRVGRMIERFDADGDGAVSMDEMPRPDEKRSARMFDMIDSDDSGGISKEEFAEMRDQMGKRRGHGSGKGNHRSNDD